MGLVLLDDRHLRPDAEEPPDRVRLDDEVVVELEPVLTRYFLNPSFWKGFTIASTLPPRPM